ncbi:MAG: CIA30 family protein [Saprospiraceae bacterium]|nr:CIA30 family protein [Saprospiraceae bacterium]
MQTIAILFMALLFGQGAPGKIDFGKRTSAPGWQVINDGVMGGLSYGDVNFTSNSVRFFGRVSLANNGGFASFRSPFGKIDLSEFSSVRFRVRGEGIRCAFTLETDRRFWMPNYKHQLKLENEGWEVLELSLADFKQYRLGRPTGRALLPETKGEIIRMGWITDEKKEGPFSLEIDYVEFIR